VRRLHCEGERLCVLPHASVVLECLSGT
jgi:hypothetical protein